MAYPISKRIVKPIFSPWIRKVTGRENIPADGSFIIAANHSSYFEVLLVPLIVILKVNKRVHAFVNSIYWDGFVTRFFLDLWGGIPVSLSREKNSRVKNKLAMRIASSCLKKGHIMLIFPEGHRSKDGKMQKGRRGAARLAMMSKAPVVPIGVIGSEKVMPRGYIFPRFKRCEVKIGKPIYFEKYYGQKINDKMLNEATRKIMKSIAKLIGQEYKH